MVAPPVRMTAPAVDRAFDRFGGRPYAAVIRAIMVTWLGTSRAASAKGIGVAPTPAATTTACLMIVATCCFLRLMSSICAAVSAPATTSGMTS